MKRNLVLIGFMGTGKTAVGKRLGELASRPFHDMDTELEARAGKSIADIFADDGEPAFRAMESALAAEWRARLSGCVIACGGGVVLNPANIEVLGANGVLVCLNASVEEILSRTASSSDRPLLETPEKEQRVRALLDERKALYAAIPHQVATTGRSVEQVMAEVLGIWKQSGAAE